jgi:hypothetical protein
MAASRTLAPNATDEERRLLQDAGDNVSDSTRRAKWIHSPDEPADRNGQTLITREHLVIQAWAEARGGRPATATRGPDGTPRTLRIEFDETSGLERIGWDEWFRVFDARDLLFTYQDRRRDGSPSTFFRLENPGREDG